MSNVYKRQIRSGGMVQQIGPNETFGVRINTDAFLLRPLGGPLYEMEIKDPVTFDRVGIMRSKTRSVLKLFERNLVCKSVLTKHPDEWPITRTPREVMDAKAYSGDVIFGLNEKKEPRRALVLCENGMLYGRVNRDLNPAMDGFIALWDKGNHWGRRIKMLSLENVREAYAKLGPEICMALAARCSKRAEVRMAGEVVELPV